MFTTQEIVSLTVSGAVALLCFVSGILFLTGRGANFIAGYNDMTDDEKEMYNVKALCRAVGVYIIIIGVIVATSLLTILFKFQNLVVFQIIASVLLTASFIIFINKSKRFKNQT